MPQRVPSGWHCKRFLSRYSREAPTDPSFERTDALRVFAAQLVSRLAPEWRFVTAVNIVGIDLSGPSNSRGTCAVVLRCHEDAAVFTQSLPLAGDSCPSTARPAHSMRSPMLPASS